MQSENNNKKRDIFTVLLGQFELRFIEREFGDYYRAKFGGILTSHAEISRLLTNTENEIGTGIFENASEFVIIGPDEREETFNSFTLKGCKTAREYGLAILSRANLVRRYYGFEELTWVEKPESPSLPPGHLLLTPDVIPSSFLEFLEASGIPDPADDLEWIIIVDADCIYNESKTRFNNGNPFEDARWYLKGDHPIEPLVWRLLTSGESIDWYRIGFADGCKAVGICQH